MSCLRDKDPFSEIVFRGFRVLTTFNQNITQVKVLLIAIKSNLLCNLHPQSQKLSKKKIIMHQQVLWTKMFPWKQQKEL